MRVWSEIFSRMPSAPLQISSDGLDWQWVQNGHSTDAGCPGAARVAFVAGFAPAYQPCVYSPPTDDPYWQQHPDEAGPPLIERAGDAIRGWLGFGDRGDPAKEVPPPPQDAPPPEPVRQP
jgi:penicillin-binding protein 1B